jgi:UDP-N-acetylmuramate dehydrogenase
MRLEPDKSLRHLNTFGIEASAKYFAEVRSLEDFDALRSEPPYARERRFVLGGGSNILLQADFDGIVIKNSIPGIEILREDDDHVWLRAGAGEVWHGFVEFCVGRGFAGIENLSLIPGQVGAAPMQNIGAYGVEVESTCESVEVVHLTSGERATFTRAGCEFGYRDSVFKRRYKDQFMVAAVTFRLDKVPRFEVGYGDIRRTLDEMGVTELSIRAVSDAVIRIRSSKLPDPKVIGNAGSFFQNPVVAREQFERIASQHSSVPHYPQRGGGVKVPAGWLIEQCGWKGRVVGRAGVHARQALVLVNHGGATGEEIQRLAADVRRSVQERFGIELVPEVELVA